MTLEEVRKEIDAIDQQLLPLFLKRMDCAKQVAEIKREQHLPVLNSNREQEILDNMAQHAGEYAGEARILYSNLMDMSRALQHNLLEAATNRELVQNAEHVPARGAHRLSGVSGSFSHEAVNTLSRCRAALFDNFAAIFAAVADGRADPVAAGGKFLRRFRQRGVRPDPALPFLHCGSGNAPHP
ncbi:MAG: chorismate mutase [Anaeromassilibacillus sp.]